MWVLSIEYVNLSEILTSHVFHKKGLFLMKIELFMTECPLLCNRFSWHED